MKTYQRISELEEIVNNDEIINGILEKWKKYKKDSKSLDNEETINYYQELLKKQLCDNKVVAINKRPFGFTILINKKKVKIVIKEVQKGATAQLIASLI